MQCGGRRLGSGARLATPQLADEQQSPSPSKPHVLICKGGFRSACLAELLQGLPGQTPGKPQAHGCSTRRPPEPGVTARYTSEEEGVSRSCCHSTCENAGSNSKIRPPHFCALKAASGGGDHAPFPSDPFAVGPTALPSVTPPLEAGFK